jgi:hypothetical protein
MRRPLGAAAVLVVAFAVAGLLWQRYAARDAVALRVPVPGGDGGGLPLASPADEQFNPAALERAAQDPAADGLEALLVMRHGHVVLARYGHGFSADTRIDSGPFARVLAGLLAGAAVQQGTLPIRALSGFDPARLRSAIEQATREPYAQYLSRTLWSRLNAASAWIERPARSAPVPADCCFEARVQDWLRIGGLLANDGSFEDTQVLRPGWIARMRLPINPQETEGLGVSLPGHGAAGRYDAADVFLLRGQGRWRLWVVPSLQLVVLFGAPGRASGSARTDAGDWDETRLPDLIIEALSDRTTAPAGQSALQQLVPGH